MLRRRVDRAIALWGLALLFACVRDNWRYPDRDAGADSAAATDVITDRPTPLDTATIDVQRTDIPIADVPATDSGSSCPSGMIFVPAGQFQMGDPTGLEPLAQPVHGVRVSAFCLDASEVTVAAYRACSAAGCTTPGALAFCNWGLGGREDHPINCVTVNQALAYCDWHHRGAGLPTEAQWEYAARVDDDRLYPWGAAAAAAQLCWSGGGTVQMGTCAVRSFPAGTSSLGFFDLGGGVAELTSTWFYMYSGDRSSYVDDPVGPASGSIRIIRGGGWRTTAANDVRAVYREGLEMGVPFSNGVGFRCALAAP